MSTSNNGKAAAAKKRTLSRMQFFELCEALRNKRETILAECKTFSALCRFLPRLGLSFELNESAVADAAAAVGLSLQRERPGPDKEARKRNILILGRSIAKLFRDLGGEPPAELVKLIVRHEGHKRPIRDEAAAEADEEEPASEAEILSENERTVQWNKEQSEYLRKRL